MTVMMTNMTMRMIVMKMMKMIMKPKTGMRMRITMRTMKILTKAKRMVAEVRGGVEPRGVGEMMMNQTMKKRMMMTMTAEAVRAEAVEVIVLLQGVEKMITMSAVDEVVVMSAGLLQGVIVTGNSSHAGVARQDGKMIMMVVAVADVQAVVEIIAEAKTGEVKMEGVAAEADQAGQNVAKAGEAAIVVVKI